MFEIVPTTIELKIVKRDFLYLMSVIQVSTQLYLAGFEPQEYARSISFEK